MSNKRPVVIAIVAGVISLGLSIAFGFWMVEINAKETIQYIITKEKQVYVLKTSLYTHEDGDYTKSKLVLLNQNHEKIKEIKLIKDIKKTIPFQNSILFFNVDDWHRLKEYIKVDYNTFTSQIVNQEMLEKSLFPQGISSIFYVSNLLKVTDKNGYTHYLDPETLKNYGTAQDEYAIRKQNPELNQFNDQQENVSEFYITQGGYTLYHIQNDNTGTQRKRVCKKNNNGEQQKIIVGFFTEKELEEEKKRKQAEIQTNCTKNDFLEAGFIGASLQHNVILVRSFRTTDHNEATIHCFDKDLKLVWEKSNTALHIDPKSLKNITVAVSEKYIFLSSKNNLIVADKGTGNFIKQVKI
jgi:hypothetical protein